MGVEKASPSESSPPWQPLSVRLGSEPIDQTWREGIPPWIDLAVRGWLDSQLADPRIRDRLFPRLHFTQKVAFGSSPVRDLSEAELLDWIDGVLHITAGESNWFMGADASDLEAILCEGHSVWKVSDNLLALERRQDAIVTAASHHAAQSARSTGRQAATDHLNNAWAAVYGLHPDTSKAYGEAVLAVEAAAVPAIVPNQPDATLGNVYGQLLHQGHLYELVILSKSRTPASPEPVTELIGLLWHGHTDRHEGNVPSIPPTQAAAEMAVHAAAMLVQWFSSNAILRKPPVSRKRRNGT